MHTWRAPDWLSVHRALAQGGGRIALTKAIVGFDGTIDSISQAVDWRTGLGTSYIPVATLADFGARVQAAAGKSTNIELYLQREKVGGNAAIMAGALATAGLRTTLVADLGSPRIHPIFKDQLARKIGPTIKLKTLGAPTHTHAIEFTDGKLMLGYTRAHEAIDYTGIIKALGGLGAARRAFARAGLISFVNWTMIPQMSAILTQLGRQVWPIATQIRGRRMPLPFIFFDLADPEKRPSAQLSDLLKILSGYTAYGRVVLGLNLKEAEQVMRVLGLGTVADEADSLQRAAQQIRTSLGIYAVAIHPVNSAVLAIEGFTYWAPGPQLAPAKIKTGAGDHFNAGLCMGLLSGAGPQAALLLAVTFSGIYVARAHSPTMAQALAVIKEGW